MCQHRVGERKSLETLLSQFCTHLKKKKVSIALQCAQAITILSRAIAVGEGFSKLGILSRGPTLLLFDMLLATGGDSGIRCSLVVCPVLVVLLGHGSFLFVLCSPLLFGCFDLFMVGRVSSNTTEVSLMS